MKALRDFAVSIPLCALLFALTAAVQAQSITFYEYGGFGGRQVSADRSIPNFDPLGMNDVVNAVIVYYGQWQICTDANYHGRCTTLSPGEYENLGAFDLRNSISSARLVGTGGANAVIPAPAMPPSSQYQPPAQYQAQPQYQPPPQSEPPPRYQPPPPPRLQPPRRQYSDVPGPPVVLYDEYDFGGSSVPVSARIDNLDITQWNDRAVSLVINEGNWELCTDAYFRGSCSVLGPGSYRDLGNGLVRQLSSIAPAQGRGHDGSRAPIPPPPVVAPQSYYPQGAARAILFSDHDLRGRSVVFDGDLPNLDGTGFNDRASSIRVEGGYWMFCSDAGYQGNCRTFGPGDYPNLPDDFERRISSVRRVAGPGR